MPPSIKIGAASPIARLVERIEPVIIPGIAAGKVQNARDLAEGDEQLASRRWAVEPEHTVYGKRLVDRFPAEFGGTPLSDPTASPFFGEHTFEIYRELLGWNEAKVAESIGDGLFT